MVSKIAEDGLEYVKKKEHKGITAPDLNDHFKTLGVKKEFIAQYREELVENKLMEISGNEEPYRVTLTASGKDYFKDNLSIERFIDKKQIFNAIIAGIIIGGLTTALAFYLSQPYRQPVNPTLRVSVVTGTFDEIPELSTQRMIEKRFAPGEVVEICVVNQGNIDSGPVVFQQIDPWAIDHAQGITNVPGLGAECLDFEIRSKECYGSSAIECAYNKYIPGDIPNGTTTINFEYRCTFCDDAEKKRKVSFDVCIWRQSGDDCN